MNTPSLRLKVYFSNAGSHQHVFTAEIIIKMIVVDIHAHSKKSRRNWFYEQFGLVFDYTDPEHREG